MDKIKESLENHDAEFKYRKLKRQNFIKLKPGKPKGAHNKRPIDPEIIDMLKKTKLKQRELQKVIKISHPTFYYLMKEKFATERTIKKIEKAFDLKIKKEKFSTQLKKKMKQNFISNPELAEEVGISKNQLCEMKFRGKGSEPMKKKVMDGLNNIIRRLADRRYL